ncbi:nucleotidyltransferase domain-containing protein [Devosia sp.]|uniref:nucleotidyltransferase domain-containing protein n=1 Tax=Devosia sp. TaxID=1871048 RepID=UPI001AC9668C|nr:nucleotidyltransferase domain-containing protein [Devosia sp.]MBN9309717.1 nucleotidyltransferase domain-containing protein [Devosia sp.]
MQTVAPNTGPFATEADALDGVLRRLVDELDPEAIWLFGSRASGRSRPDSDFDLLVVTKTSDGELATDYDRVYAPILGLGVGCDVVPCPITDFLLEKDKPTSFVHEIVRTGRKLYDRRQG